MDNFKASFPPLLSLQSNIHLFFLLLWNTETCRKWTEQVVLAKKKKKKKKVCRTWRFSC